MKEGFTLYVANEDQKQYYVEKLKEIDEELLQRAYFEIEAQDRSDPHAARVPRAVKHNGSFFAAFDFEGGAGVYHFLKQLEIEYGKQLDPDYPLVY